MKLCVQIGLGQRLRALGHDLLFGLRHATGLLFSANQSGLRLAYALGFGNDVSFEIRPRLLSSSRGFSYVPQEALGPCTIFAPADCAISAAAVFSIQDRF